MKFQKYIYLFFLLFIYTNSWASSGKAGSNITWNLDNNGVLTFKGSGMMKDFGDTPYRPILVKEVLIDEGITNIGNNAFKDCKNLTEIFIPNTCTVIGKNAFAGCSALSEIKIPFGVTKIEDNAFEGCSAFKSIDIPSSVKTIGDNAFKNCRDLVKIRISSAVTNVGKNAFKNCKYIQDILEIPEYITSENAWQYGLKNGDVSKYWDKVNQPYIASNTKIDNLDIQEIREVPKKERTPNFIPVSDVDFQIPVNHIKNEKTYAVIISNEYYGKMEDVPYAHNDGNIFAKYCENTLGIPSKNIFRYSDATSGVFREALNDLKITNKIVGEDMKVIFYYSGHGAPDISTGEGFLIPVDASRVSPTVCMPLSELYESLGSLNVELAVVFLDACFSGGERTGGTLMADRGGRSVKIAQQEMDPKGKVVVFNATESDQTALPYEGKGHGIFTYFLLKKLKDTSGNTSLGELADYLKKMVSDIALHENRAEQTPTVYASPIISKEWNRHKLNY